MKATDIMRTLQTDIDRLGAELVMCTDNCAGICCDQQAGVLPRGLHLDLRDVTRRGCLAVGQNPGPSNVSHRNHFRAPRISYDRVKAFYANAERFSYYKKALIIIHQLGFAGPILWSNLAKCESKKASTGLLPLPIQTGRHCAERFLRHELDAAPEDWPVLAFGEDAFVAIAYLAPNRSLIGIPHPTGGHGRGTAFKKMLKKNGQLRKKILDRANGVLSAKEPGAVWLGSGKRLAQ